MKEIVILTHSSPGKRQLRYENGVFSKTSELQYLSLENNNLTGLAQEKRFNKVFHKEKKKELEEKVRLPLLRQLF